MKLLNLTGAFASWYGAAFGAFLRHQPKNALLLVVSKVLLLVTTVLARVLPIKAILLVGSPGVPSYFQAIVPPDRKMEGLVALAIASIVAYASGFALEAAIARMTRTGSRAVVNRANDIVLSDQLETANVHYDRIAGVAASLTFGVVAVLILAIASRPVLWTVLASVLILYTMAAVVLRFGDTHKQGSLAYAVVNHLGTVLNVAVVLTFISTFVVILWPFLTGGESHVLLAIIAVVLVRRLLGVLAGTVKTARSLFDKAPQINQLFLRAHRQEATEKPDWRIMRDSYVAEDRESALKQALPDVFPANARLATRWMDPIAAVQRQGIDVQGKAGSALTYIERVYPLAGRHRLDNESFLFSKLRPETIGAPHPMGEFQHGPFLSQVTLCGKNMRLIERANWPACSATAVSRLWSAVLPPDLIDAYTTTHRLLPERLNEALVSRATLAADSPEAAGVHKAFLSELPNLRIRLERLPLVLVNPDISASNIMMGPDGDQIVVDWSRWAIEPIGFANCPRDLEKLQGLLEQVSRPDLDKSEAAATEIMFASSMGLLEKALLKQRYRTAVELMGFILENAQFAGADDEDADELETAVA